MHKVISLIVIGANSSADLRESRFQQDIPETWERIYVDSDSTDESRDLAQSQGFRVVHLRRQSAFLTAAAGRREGAILARGEWLVFLDSDMEPPAPEPIVEAIRCFSDDARIGGFTGEVIDVYPDGSRRIRSRGKKGTIAAHFGGFVVLKREALLQSGNWCPNLAGNEEIELYARLKKTGFIIRYDSQIKCLHHGAKTSQMKILLSTYWPIGARTERFGAYGVALKTAIKSGSWYQFICLVPEPVLMLAFLIVLLRSATGDWEAFSALLASALLISVALLSYRRRSISYMAAVPGLTIQLVTGLFKSCDVRYTVLK